MFYNRFHIHASQLPLLGSSPIARINKNSNFPCHLCRVLLFHGINALDAPTLIQADGKVKRRVRALQPHNKKRGPTRSKAPTLLCIAMAGAPAQFAQELIDEVIDHLHDDTPTLRSCAMASRSCAMRARKHIHSNLAIGSIGCGPRMMQYPCKALRYQKIHHLRNFPALASCVRTMTASESMETLTTSPISFPRLHTLRMFNIVWRSLSPETGAFVTTALGGVKSLILNSVGFDCFNSFLFLLDGFPALAELTVENCYFQNDTIPDDAQRVVSLRRLTISSDKTSNIFVEWLKSQVIPPVIDELVVPGGTGLASDETVNRLARIAGPSVRHFRFAFGWVWPGGFLKRKLFPKCLYDTLR